MNNERLTYREYKDEYGENPYQLIREEQDIDKPRCEICGRVMEVTKEPREYNGAVYYEEVYYCPIHD